MKNVSIFIIVLFFIPPFLSVAQVKVNSSALKNNFKLIPYGQFILSDYGKSDISFGIGFDRIFSKSGKIGITSTLVYGYHRKEKFPPKSNVNTSFNFISGFRFFPWGQKRFNV